MYDNSNLKKRMKDAGEKLVLFCTVISVFFAGCMIIQPEKQAEAAKRIIVTIDPGHGGLEKGAYVHYKGHLICEKDLNLSIARYMKKELETYKNVTVHLTRSDDRTVSLDDRVLIAKKNNSNLFFSIHNNAGGYSYHDGACVLVSSGQYHKELSTVTETIGSVALEQISASLGIADRGYLRRLSEVREYPNKQPADYYAIVRGGTEAGIASMILEHAFIDDANDLKKLIKKSVQQKLGKIDATAVAKYYGLAKKNGKKKYRRLGPDIKMVTRHWMLKDGKYYFVTKKEKVLTGWATIKKEKYHFSPSGAATKGFHKMDQDYYYFNEFGNVFCGWKKVKRNWYYFRKNGKALKDCTKVIAGKKYRFGKNGRCLNRK